MKFAEIETKTRQQPGKGMPVRPEPPAATSYRQMSTQARNAVDRTTPHPGVFLFSLIRWLTADGVTLNSSAA